MNFPSETKFLLKFSTDLYIFAVIQAYFLRGHTSRHKGLQPEDRPFGHYIRNQGVQKQS